MKIVFTLLLFIFLFTACTSESNKTEVIRVKASDLVSKTVAVKGMTCVGCETRFEKAILKMEGVLRFKASSQNNTATLEFDKSKTDLKTVKKALDKLSANSCL
jgi:copper chaperone CopZ